MKTVVPIVGIGATSPVDPLSIGTAVNASATHASLNLSNTALVGGSANGTYLGANPAAFTGNFIDLQVGGTSKFKVDNTGKVTGDGSGLTGVSGSASLSSLTAASGTNTIDNLLNAQTWNWSTATTQSPLSISANALTTGSLLNLTTSNASVNSTNGLLNVANTGASTSGLVARIQSNSTADSGLTVRADGNVGIGTSTPIFPLQIIKDGNFNTVARIQNLSVNILANAGFAARTDAGSFSFGINSSGSGTDPSNAFVWNNANSAIQFATNGTEKMRISATGDLGVGATSPGAKLDVTAGANAIAIQSTGQSLTGANAQSLVNLTGTWNTTGTPTLIKANVTDTASNAASLLMDLQVGGVSKFKVDKTGKVTGDGSGLTGVAGSASMSSITAASATNTIDNLLNAQTWNWSTATTQSPLSISANALTTGSLMKLTTSSGSINSTSGLLNVANTSATTTGTLARFQSNSTAGSGLTVLANGNVGVGTAAPGALFEVAGQVKITGGTPGAGKVLTSNGVGLASWTTPAGFTYDASNNLKAGNGAFITNTSGGENIALGSSALAFNATTSYNVGIGYYSLYYNTGTANVATGVRSLFNTTGSYNSAFGPYAMDGNTTGSDNVGMGRNANYYNTTGSGNVAIGTYAGGTSTPANGNTTGSNNVFIGNDSGPGTATQLNNATTIGAGARVTASDSLVLGNSSVSVGIGTTAPAAKLDVNGAVAVNSSYESVIAYTNSSTAYTVPDTTANIRRITLTGNATITLPAFTAPSTKMYTLTLFLKQDASGGRTVTFAGNGADTILWDTNTAPTIAAGIGKISIIQLTKASDETVWYGSQVWKGE